MLDYFHKIIDFLLFNLCDVIVMIDDCSWLKPVCFSVCCYVLLAVNIRNSIITCFRYHLNAFCIFRLKDGRHECYQNVLRLYVISIFELNVMKSWSLIHFNTKISRFVSCNKGKTFYMGNPCQFFFRKRCWSANR